MDTFLNTLDRLSRMINSRLRPGVSKVWVQGVNAGNARLIFTIFFTDSTKTPFNCGYITRFMDVKNFRHYRPDGDPDNELRLLDAYMVQFVRVLGDVIE
jgi:hypothetical protein